MSEPLPLDAGPLSPVFDLAGVLVQEQKAELDMLLEEDIQEEIDLAKLQGLEATRRVINSWYHDLNTWKFEVVSKETVNKLLQGTFNTFNELLNYDSEVVDYSKDVTILYRIVKNDNKERPVYVIETLFINE